MLLLRRLRPGNRTAPRPRCAHQRCFSVAAPAPTELLGTLRERQLVKDCTDAAALDVLVHSNGDGTAPVRAYLGFDPTARSLHVGHLIGLRLLLRLHNAGLPAIALVGGTTAVVGDPSGRTSERTALSTEAVNENARHIHAMLERLLSAAQPASTAGASTLPLVLNNSAWLAELKVTDLLTGAGRHLRMGAMLSKDNVRTRLAESGAGLSFAEFAYPLLQGYDWVHLASHYNCRVQVGGSDQWGNLVDGAQLVRKALADTPQSTAPPATTGEQDPPTAGVVVGLTCPLLVDSSGAKLGKSGGNAVWLDPSLTSPYELYQFFRQLDDQTAGVMLRQLTDLPLAEIDALTELQVQYPAVAAASTRLACAVVEWVHGEQAAQAAASATAALFSSSSHAAATDDAGAGQADAEVLSPQQVGGLVAAIRTMGGAAETRLSRAEVLGAPLLELCVAAKLTTSKGAARRLVNGGGLSLNQTRIHDPAHVISDADILTQACGEGRAGGGEGGEDAQGIILLGSGKKRKVIVSVV